MNFRKLTFQGSAFPPLDALYSSQDPLLTTYDARSAHPPTHADLNNLATSCFILIVVLIVTQSHE